jgi:hypothetical protein
VGFLFKTKVKIKYIITMDINEYKKIKNEIENQTFNNSYSQLDKVLKVLSVFGNIGSIFLASFFISKLIENSVTSITSPVAIWIITLTLLGSLELIKRFIFDKFSGEFVKAKTIFRKEVFGVAFFSIAIIGMSFYSSLNGAQEISSKSGLIEETAANDISEYNDEVNTTYNGKIDLLNDETIKYKAQLEIKDGEQLIINQSLQERGYLFRGEKDRNKQLITEKEKLEEKVEKNDIKIEELETERDNKIEEYKLSVESDSLTDISSNQSNSLIFIGISTIIEFLILIGIYFDKYYIYRSYKEMRNKINSDPGYQKWSLYSSILEIIYMNSTEGEHTKLNSQKSIWEFCNRQDLPMAKSELGHFMKLMEVLKITSTKGSSKFLMKDKEESEMILKEYFKIK